MPLTQRRSVLDVRFHFRNCLISHQTAAPVKPGMPSILSFLSVVRKSNIMHRLSLSPQQLFGSKLTTLENLNLTRPISMPLA